MKKEKKIPFWITGLKVSVACLFVSFVWIPPEHRTNGYLTWALMYYIGLGIGLLSLGFGISAVVTRYRMRNERKAKRASSDTADFSSSDELDAKAT